MNNARGSLWRRWDFHFHTPSSFDYKNKGVTNEQIVDGLKRAGISAVVVSDHHIIDIERIRQLQTISGNELTIFPGIELRSDLGGSDSIHLIGIFDPNCQLEELWTKMQGQLAMTRGDIAKAGDEKFYVPFRDAARFIRSQGGVVSVHAGKKSNSIENIANSPKFKQQIKKDLAFEFIDIFEVNSIESASEYKRIVFPDINRDFPLVICSDNHNAKEFKVKESTWVEADTTLDGLKHAILESESRFFIGQLPEKVARVENNSTRYIEGIEIHKKPGSKFAESWFDSDLQLNEGLVAIIGNKGSGKSALADIIGLLGDSKQESSFSFLNETKFREVKNNKSQHFVGTLKWKSGNRSTKDLSEHVGKNTVELVKYIPQNYLEKICNEISSSQESEFDKELKKVIFSHVDPADRLEKESLDEAIEERTGEVSNAISSRKKELSSINQKIIELEEMQDDSYRESIQNQLKVKREQIAAHDKRKPKVVPRPDKAVKDPATQKILGDLKAAKRELDDLTKEIAETENQRSKAAKLIALVDNLKQRFENFSQEYEELARSSSPELRKIGIDLSDILTVKIDLSRLTDLRKKSLADRRALDLKLNEQDTKSLVNRKAAAERKMERLKAKLDEPNKRYADYEKALKDWQNKKDEIIGKSNIAGSLRYFEGQLKELSELPDRITEATEQRKQVVREIYTKISELVEVYQTLYEPVQQFIATHELAKDRFNLKFQVSIVESNFVDTFLEKINQRVSGSFMGTDEARERLRNLLAKYDLNKKDEVISFLEDIINHLKIDMSGENFRPNSIQAQLRKGIKIFDLYEYVFALDYLKPKYSLTLGEKPLSQLSPGEKGMLLLVFYLLIDKEDIPLIIDQPEENLDNQTVFQVLVPCIKEAKNRRQIVIVTHNPNLAVVCDADQVITAQHDKKDNERITYISGSIENSPINKAVVDILEGTKKAFDNRDAKYLPTS